MKKKGCFRCTYQYKIIGRMKGSAKMAIKKELLEILACPKCKGDIYLNQKEDGLICEKCQLLYAIRDDIPIMLIDEATSIKR